MTHSSKPTIEEVNAKISEGTAEPYNEELAKNNMKKELHKAFSNPTPNRITLMQEAINLTQGDRQEEYGSFLRNMETWAAMLTTYIVEKYRGDIIDESLFSITAEDAAQFMVLNKIMRTMQPSATPKVDSFVDEACYAAMAGEAAFAHQEEEEE